MALTDQKLRYAKARLSGLGKKASAVEAGCPERTAAQAATRLERDPDVKALMGRITAAELARTSKKPLYTVEPPNIDPTAHIAAQAGDPLDFMRQLMNDLEADPKLRLEAAKSLASYLHAKPGDKGKKSEQEDAAKQAAKGKFKPTAPPLRAVK